MTGAKSGPHPAATLNGLDLRFWGEMPLPLAEAGTRLDAVSADYLDALLGLAENAITVAGAMGLSQLPPAQIPTAERLLTKPALGSRIELLWLLEGATPDSTGWDPDGPMPEQAAFVAMVNPGSQTRNPRTRQVFEAITKLRNDKHHGRLPQDRHEDAVALLEDAVFAIIRRNRRFFRRCYYIDSVQRAADGSEDVTAWTLWGPMMTRYRRGYRQTTRVPLLPHRVVQGELEDPLDLHPFLVVRHGRVFVLDELRKSGPVYRHLGSRETLENAPRLDPPWLARPPTPRPEETATLVQPRVSLPAVVPAEKPNVWRLAALGVGGLVVACVLSAIALGLASHFGSSTVPTPRPAAASAIAEATTTACPVAARPDIPPERDLPRLLSGAPVQWGTPVSEVEQVCGSLRRVPFVACSARFVDVRATSWGPTFDIPSRRETQLAFHPTRGLFEIMVWSDVDAEALAAAVEQRLGRPHRTQGRHRFWSLPPNEAEPTTRLKVSPLPDGHPRGRSAIRLHYPPTTEVYGAEMRAAGCQR